MANAIATINTDLQKMHAFGNLYIVIGTISVDPDPANYTAGGIAVNWGSLVKSSKQPIFFTAGPTVNMMTDSSIYQVTLNAAGEQSLQLDPTQPLSDLLLVVSADGTESTDATPVSADISGQAIPFMAIFQGQL